MSTGTADWSPAEQRIAELARTRRGRHRNLALASWRKTRAVELRATGMSYAEIAAEVGYANRGTAHAVVTQALASREAESVDLLRQVELGRLDAVHAALWPQAMAGDVPSVMALLRQRGPLPAAGAVRGTGRQGVRRALGQLPGGRPPLSSEPMTVGTKGVSGTGDFGLPRRRLVHRSRAAERRRIRRLGGPGNSAKGSGWLCQGEVGPGCQR